MGAEELLDSLKQTLEEILEGTLLKVNPNTGIYEEDSDLPIEPGDDYEIPDIDPDQDPENPEDAEREPAEIKTPEEPKLRKPAVFKMNLPDREDLYSQIPYLLLQLLTIKDKYDKEEKDRQSIAEVRCIIVTYNDDGQEGGMQVWRLIEKIRIALERGILLNQNYVLQFPFECQVYPDDTGVYYLGQIDMTWSVPVIQRTHKYVETAVHSGSVVTDGIMDQYFDEEGLWSE